MVSRDVAVVVARGVGEAIDTAEGGGTGGIESCFHGNHPEYIETTEKMM